jgi:hypothetical protein
MWNTGRERNQDRIAFRRQSSEDPCPLRQDPSSLLMQAVEKFWRSNSLPGPQQQVVTGAGQTVSTRLLTRRAGVHVDFHAHRHFHNLRSFPTHQGFSQAVLARGSYRHQN